MYQPLIRPHLQWPGILATVLILLIGCESSVPGDITTSAPAEFHTKNIVLVVIDGPRFVDTWGDPLKANIPHFANELASQGVHYSKFYNTGATYTTSGHTAITTGNYQWMSNDGSEFPHHASIFQRWLEKYQLNPNQAQIITGKSKLEVLSDCSDPEWRGRYNPKVHAEDRDDQATQQEALRILKEHHPKLSLIHFRGPDHFGHSNQWDKYTESITETDGYVFEIWEFIQSDPHYRDATAMLVTNDHGRHNDGVRDGFVSHGDFCEGCMHINLYAVGPDFKSNLEIDIPRQSVDIASTIAAILSFEQAGSGEVMWELFK